MIERVEKAKENKGIEANFEIIDSLDELVNYNTWLLPTLVINDQKKTPW